jgi:hypothetical protein
VHTIAILEQARAAEFEQRGRQLGAAPLEAHHRTLRANTEQTTT